MIESMTKDQEALVDTYLKMGFKYGLGLKQDQPSIEEINGYVERVYSAIGLKRPLIFHVDSPLAGNIATNSLVKVLNDNNTAQLRGSTRGLNSVVNSGINRGLIT